MRFCSRAHLLLPSLPPHVQPGPLYLLRVVGDSFSFYSTQLSAEFLQGVADYADMPEEGELQETPVYKYSAIHGFDFGATPSAAAAALGVLQEQWQFKVPADRKHIIGMLYQIKQILLKG